MAPRRSTLTPAAIYLRLSAVSDDSASIEVQESELTSLAAREGWRIDHVLIDKGISGTKGREKADRAVEMLRDGTVDVLATYKLDRLSRQGLSGLASLFIALDEREAKHKLDRAPAALFVAHKDGLRSDMPGWKLMGPAMAGVAAIEAENTATRMRSAVEHRHRIGRHTGGPPPFGYRTAPARDFGKTLVIDEGEHDLVKELAEAFLDGVGVATLARRLREARVPTAKSEARLDRIGGVDIDAPDFIEPTEAERRERLNRRQRARGDEDDVPLPPYRGIWDATTVRRLLTSDRITGRVTHKGKLVTGEDGLPLNHYPPVLTADTVERIKAKIKESARPATPDDEGEPKARERAEHLLTGLAYCSGCGRRMWAGGRTTYRTRDGVRTPAGSVAVYRCVDRGAQCPAKTFVRAEALEALVVERYLAIAGWWPELEEVAVVDHSTEAALADIERAANDLHVEARHTRGAERAALFDKIDALEDQAANLRAIPATVAREYRPTGRTLADAWHAAEDVVERRLTLLRALDHVSVARPEGRGRRFDPNRVTFYWYPSPDEFPTWAT